MKKILLSVLFLTAALFSEAQQKDVALALKYVTENKAAIGLSDEDLANSIVSSSYFNKFAGTQMVYLQQSYLGLPVLNQLKVLSFKDGKVVSVSGSRVVSMDQKVQKIQLSPSVSPEQALKTAFRSKKITVPSNLNPAGSGRKLDFGKMNVSHENVTAELMWVPLKEGKDLRLAWQIYFAPTTTSDYWLIRVDAHQGKIIDETNLTVYCNWGPEADHKHMDQCFEQNQSPVKVFPSANQPAASAKTTSPSIVSNVTYLVIPYPAENRLVPGGVPAIRTNPWTLAGGNASTLGWHNDGTTDYLNTRGNNVYAQEDRDASNSTFGSQSVSSSGPDPLTFNFTPNFTITPLQTTPVQNQQFNITNLFYWNNIIHDLTYVYGFDEAAGNFQNSNLGRGGAGSDYVIADGQDAASTNNANFSTPQDGQRPRMQMFLWNGSPQRDGDADNGIMVHEYGHGISNRLTGGPSESGCLGNSEQMGEGWSDYYALMYTQDWASATLNTGFNTPRGLGLYVLNGNNLFGGSAPGTGIRHIKYSTDFSVNSQVYLANLPDANNPHDRGEIWAAALWDMTWAIINQVGSINPNLFDASGTGGNSIALKLVTEGMKLQPCSPGFISGRDAILQADQILYNGQFECTIREAFRRRGMGAFASQGSSSSTSDQVPDFSKNVTLKLTQAGMTSVPEGENIVYTNTISSKCDAISNYILRDTLPENVTFVSANAGGTYDNATRVVSFPVNQASGSTATYSFTVNVNAGTYFTPLTLLSDQVSGSVISSIWTTTATPAANVWTVSGTISNSSPNSYFVQNLASSGDQRLFTTNSIALPQDTTARFSFSHRYNTEDGWDGGVVEISTNNGTTWKDLGNDMIVNGYPSNLGTNATNVISGRKSFSGLQSTFIRTSINLRPYAGQNVKFRFRFGSDDNTTAPTTPAGWWIDDIELKVTAEVDMRSILFNASNVRQVSSDTLTIITEGNTCSNVAISTQPADQTGCIGSTVTFSVNASGTTPDFQWQISTDNGATYTDIPGETSATLVLTGVTNAMNNNRYRVALANTCPSNIVSNGAILTISNQASIVNSPENITVCAGAPATFTVAASGSSLTYQWQVSIDGGTTYSDINAATTATLTVTGVTASMQDNLYRAVVRSCGATASNSASASLSVNEPQIITTAPISVSLCPGLDATFSVAATGTSVTYQWQRSTDSGGTFTDIAGETSGTLTVSSVMSAMNNFRYRALVKSACTPAGAPTTAATLTVIEPAVITGMPSDKAKCLGDNTTFNIIATGSGLTYQWQISEQGGAFTNVTDNTVYSGSQTAELSVSGLTLAMSGNVFRVLINGTACSSAVTSEEATLTVTEQPGVIIAVSPSGQITSASASTLVATVTPPGNYTFVWKKDDVIVPNVNTSSISLSPDNYGTYSVSVSDGNGCFATSNTINVSDLVIRNYIFIYPNPSRGMFQVRYFTDVNIEDVRAINVFDRKGALVYRRLYTAARTYDAMDVDLTGVSKGLYMLELLGTGGKRLATAKVIVN